MEQCTEDGQKSADLIKQLSSYCQGCLPPKGNENFCFLAPATPEAHWSIFKLILTCIGEGLQPKLSQCQPKISG